MCQLRVTTRKTGRKIRAIVPLGKWQTPEAIADMIVRFDAAYGLRMSPAVVFAHPNIATLARHIAAHATRDAGEPAVPHAEAAAVVPVQDASRAIGDEALGAQ